MKRLIATLVVLLLLISVVSVSADESNVIYDGLTQEFVFQPGSEHSLTDLFLNFKDVMPGDSLTQSITVRNESDKQVKVEIYIRSLGAHEDSVDFLSQLRLRVEKSEDNTMAYMFDAYANEPAQLTDWVCLGMLYSGGEVNLNVILDVPVEMGNEFQDQIGYLDWEFMVIEYPAEEDDPIAPTGDESNVPLMLVLMGICAAAAIFLLLWRRKNREEEEEHDQ